jgi:hypothetical protein
MAVLKAIDGKPGTIEMMTLSCRNQPSSAVSPRSMSVKPMAIT